MKLNKLNPIFLAVIGMTILSGSYLSGQQQRDSYYYGSSYADDHVAPYGTDWDYEESWRNNKQAYYSGKTQPQAYRDAHPYGQGGIGYDADPTYAAMEQSYKQNHQGQGYVGGQQQQRYQRSYQYHQPQYFEDYYGNYR